jgi:hypothetical protein
VTPYFESRTDQILPVTRTYGRSPVPSVVYGNAIGRGPRFEGDSHRGYGDGASTEPTTGNLDPFPAVRVQSGCSDLGQSRAQLRQLYASQCPRIRLLTGLRRLRLELGAGTG